MLLRPRTGTCSIRRCCRNSNNIKDISNRIRSSSSFTQSNHSNLTQSKHNNIINININNPTSCRDITPRNPLLFHNNSSSKECVPRIPRIHHHHHNKDSK